MFLSARVGMATVGQGPPYADAVTPLCGAKFLFAGDRGSIVATSNQSLTLSHQFDEFAT